MKKVLFFLFAFALLSTTSTVSAQWIYSWYPTNGPTDNVGVLSLCVVGDANSMLWAGTDGLGTSELGIDGGWASFNSGLANLHVRSMVYAGPLIEYPYLYAGTDSGLYRTSDEMTWEDNCAGIPHNSKITSLTARISLASEIVFAGTNDSLYMTTLVGYQNHWATFYGMGDSISALTTADFSSGELDYTLFVGTSNGKVFKNDILSLSEIDSGLENIHKINCLISINSTIFAGTNNGVFYLPYLSTSWLRYGDSTLNGIDVRCLLEMPSFPLKGEGVIAGTEIGVYHIYAQQSNWINSNGSGYGGLMDHDVLSMANQYDILYVGTKNHGVWYSVLWQDVPEYSLPKISVYPIPTDGMISILGIENPKVEMFTITGQCLIQSRGNKINISSLPSGVYFLRINNNPGMKKIIKI